MSPPILEKLNALEAEHGMRILFAAEAGSRAWGFASADSDYDVRFVYAWPRERYLSIDPPSESVDHVIDEHEIDLSGWELRKALRLFRKSNGALIEWLNSPIIYRAESSLFEEWRDLLSVGGHFSVRRSAAHYLGLARGMAHRLDAQPEKVTAKRYLYLMRSLVAARFVVEKGTPPPVLFTELLDQSVNPREVEDALHFMIATKSSGAESDGIERVAVLDDRIREELPQIEAAMEALPRNEIDLEPLDRFFNSTLDHHAIS